MGVSTNGCLAYGVCFEDGYEFPWDAERFNGDIEDWWRTVNGFEDPIHNVDGNWIGGVKPSQDEYDKFFAYQRTFDSEHPCPVSVENFCSGEYPMWLLAVPSSCHGASRGEPQMIDTWPTVTDDEVNALREFLVKYELESDSAEGWWLYSYWG